MMWRGRIKIAPVVIGALRTIKKGSDQKLQLLPAHPLATEDHTNEQMHTAFITCWGISL
jgi:hypothetical protein